LDAAQLPRDYFLDAPRAGTFVLADAYTLGVQATVERRSPLFGDLGQLSVRTNLAVSLPYADMGTHVDARFLFLTLGATLGWRLDWTTIAFDRPLERGYGRPDLLGMQARERYEEDGRTRTTAYPYGEVRARVTLPIAKVAFVLGDGAYRYEHRPSPDGLATPSFDWFHNTVYDRGGMWRATATLFFRHPSLGAVGPTMRVLALPRAGALDPELAVGGVLAARVGLKDDRDLFFFTLLFSPGDALFGEHSFPGATSANLRFYVLAAYRIEWKL
jgi:hypothetical protein